jgi:hypothetical protein
VNQLSPELERQAVTEAANMSDDVARLAQWFCLQCEGFFPGALPKMMFGVTR